MSGRDIAFDLLRRLLAGERECVSLRLGMLLEKSFQSLDGSDRREDYAWVLPPEMLDVQLSAECLGEVIAAICKEISLDPKAAYFSVVNSLGLELPVRTAAMVLANPPRMLALEEYEVATGFLNKYLTYYLEENPEFLSRTDLGRLIEVFKALQMLEDVEDPAANLYGIRHHADQLVERLTFDSKRISREKSAGARVAKDLLRRLLAGERGNVPQYLADLLEKSSAGANTVYHYRRVLPQELAKLRLSDKTLRAIVSAIGAEFARDPDPVYFSILCRPLSDSAVGLVAKILVNPPRPLTIAELDEAFERLHFVLPFTLLAYPQMLTAAEHERFIEELSRIQKLNGSASDQEQFARVSRLAGEMLDSIHRFETGR
jgi:hypothetical protein